jgi:HPt (histidine-containing phosphotransfer) domain-containing protein/CheY-like chemotaxis protein
MLNETVMSTLRLLLVDPNSDQAVLQASVAAGSIVLPASNFHEASEAIVLQRFDAILLREPLSLAAVEEFIKALRNLEEAQKNLARTPVLLLSANAAPGSGWTPAPDENTGIDGILPIHFDHETLLEAVDRSAASKRGSVDRLSSPPAVPVFDRHEFRMQMGDDPALIIEIIDLFFEECARQIPQIRQSLATGKYEEVSKLAHTMKGSFSSLHAPQARSISQDLESSAKLQDLPGCERAVAALEQSIDSINPLLLELHAECEARLS